MPNGLICPKCGADKVHKEGHKHGFQVVRCLVCHRYSTIKPSSSAPEQAPVKQPGYLSLAKVIEKFDIAAAIHREIAGMPKGQLMLEVDLCQKVAGYDRQRFRRTVENKADEFRPFRIRLRVDEGDAKWYWGSADDITQALKIRDE